MRVLIPELAEDAAPLAAELAAQGHQVLAVPSVTVTPEEDVALNLVGAQAFLVASPVAARALAEKVAVRMFPVFADSHATAEALTRLGFTHAEAAQDAHELANLVQNRLQPANGALIHPCDAYTPSNRAVVLTNMGFAARPLPLYTLTRVADAPTELHDAVTAGNIDVAVFTTAEAAQALVTLLLRDKLTGHARTISALAATATAAAPLRGLKLLGITVADDAGTTGLALAIAVVESDRAKAVGGLKEERKRRRAERTTEEERRKQEAKVEAERERQRQDAERKAAEDQRKKDEKRRKEEGRQRLAAERKTAVAVERKRVEAEQASRAAENAALLHNRLEEQRENGRKKRAARKIVWKRSTAYKSKKRNDVREKWPRPARAGTSPVPRQSASCRP